MGARAVGFDVESNALDSGLLGAVVDLGKGRKLLARVLKLLPQQVIPEGGLVKERLLPEQSQ